MLVDEVTITVKGGNGGDGRVSFFPMKNGPDGGNGGDGGNVYLTINSQLPSLYKYQDIRIFEAEAGQAGGPNRCVGSRGKDLTMQMPKGTFITDCASGEVVELTEANSPFLVARGGQGGRGNDEFKSAVHRVPRKFEPGFPGEERKLRLEMKYIADVGLMGLPNAGKSSLLNELTAANPKIANYPFTTLEPNLGVYEGQVIADIPGLIEGASNGRGMGVKFLKHIERVHLLIHCISVESDNLERDYNVIINELKQFNPELLSKKMVILLTKCDLATKTQIQEKLKLLAQYKIPAFALSIYDYDSLMHLKNLIKKL